MPVAITPSPVALPATIPIPADGEAVNSASVAQYVQTLANAQQWAISKVPGLSPLAIWSYPSEASIHPASAWSVNYFTGGYSYLQQNVLTGEEIFFPFRLAQGMSVGNFGVLLCGVSGHALLPANMPTVSFVELDVASSIGLPLPPVMNVITTVSDSSAIPATYEFVHNAYGAAAPNTIGRSMYGIRLTGESGANSIAGLRVLGAFVEAGPA